MSFKSISPLTMVKLANLNKRQVLLLSGITAVSLFFHFYNLGYGEFSNDETIAVTYSAYFMHGFDNPLFFGSLFIYPHPPVRILVNIPFMLLFSVSETVLRFPHALFGALTIIPLYLSGEKLYGRKAAILAGLLYAVSGVSAVNRQSQGVGIYVFFVLLAFYYLILFIEDKGDKSEAHHLLLVSLSLTIATFTYLEAIVFSAPVLYFILRKKRRGTLTDPSVRKAGLVYFAGLVIYALFWFIMPAVAYRLGYINTASSGNLEHIAKRASGLLTLNIVPILIQYIKYNSVFGVTLLTGGITAGIYFLKWKQGFLINALYLLPHLLVWTFVLNPIIMHPMYDFPLVALLAAGGLGKLLDVLKHHRHLLGIVQITIGLCLILSGWHHYVAHNQDAIEFSPKNLVFWETTNSPIRLGTKGAGYYIRSHSQDITEQIFGYGTGSAGFYAGRLDKNNDIRKLLTTEEIKNVDDLSRSISQSQNWKNVRYIVMTVSNKVLWNYAQAHYALKAVVTVKGEPSLYIFDTREAPDVVAVDTIPLEKYEILYNQKYGHWRETVPWFLTMARERL